MWQAEHISIHRFESADVVANHRLLLPQAMETNHHRLLPVPLRLAQVLWICARIGAELRRGADEFSMLIVTGVGADGCGIGGASIDVSLGFFGALFLVATGISLHAAACAG